MGRGAIGGGRGCSRGRKPRGPGDVPPGPSPPFPCTSLALPLRFRAATDRIGARTETEPPRVAIFLEPPSAMERDEPRRPPPGEDESPPPSPSPLLPWPPPGLARIQGDAWWIARKLIVGGLILVVPLFLAMAPRDPFDLGGALGDAWWVTGITSAAGLLLLAFAFRDTARLLGRSVQAMKGGHGRFTVALVAADRARDMGFLLQGERHFSTLDPAGRQAMAMGRIAAAGVLLLGALWVPFGFTLSLLLGTRGVLAGPLSAFWFTLIPFVAALVFVGALLIWETSVVRRARGKWHKQPWSRDLERTAIERWGQTFRERVEARVAVPGRSDATRTPAVVRWIVYVGGAGTILVALALTGVMSLASVLSTMTVPVLGAGPAVRVADVEPLRRYAVEPDPEITPQEAGEILQVVLTVGAGFRERPGTRPPVRRHEAPWLPRAERAEGALSPLDPEWRASLFERARSGLEEWELDYLREAANHPASQEVSRLARAPSLDVFHGRLEMPLPPGTSTAGLYVGEYAGFRIQGMTRQLLEAALLAAEGRDADAELRIRETISIGLLLVDDGPFLIDNLVGAMIAATGGDALEAFFRATGREGEARDLAWARAAAIRSAERGGRRTPTSTAQGLREMSRIVGDSLTIRGLRWETFMGVNSAAPCLNMERIVFGPGPEHRNWIEESRDALVRWPSEEQIFDLAQYGHFGHSGPTPDPPVYLKPLIRLMGGGDEPGSCGAAIARMFQTF